jgi:guanylate kinase
MQYNTYNWPPDTTMAELPFDYVSHTAKSKRNSPLPSLLQGTMKVCGIIGTLLTMLFVLVRFQSMSANFISRNFTSGAFDYEKRMFETDDTLSIFNGNHHDPVAFRPLVVSGPSGVGKGTLINKLVEFYNHRVDEMIDSHEFQVEDNQNIHELFGFSVSHTTRGPRPGEVEGIHYHFTNMETMKKSIQKHDFIEHAEVHGNLYGTSYESVQNVISSQRICILDIDVQGAKRVKEDSSLDMKPYFIFIAPPSMEILERRLRDRGTEKEDAVLRRIGNARSEVEYGTSEGNFDQIIVNDDLEITFLHLRQVLEEWYPHLNQIPSPSHEF